METNKELLKKAVIAADSLAVAGKLSPKQANRFIDYMIDETMLKDEVRIERFTNEQMYIDKIGVGNRVALPAAEASAPRVRRGVSTSRVELQPKEIMVPFEITDKFGRINIEGDKVKDHVVKMMSIQCLNNIEELLIGGDLLAPAVLESEIVDGGSTTQYVKDSFLGLCDGWLRRADSGHIYDAANAAVSPALFNNMLNQMPNKFKRNKANLRFLVDSTTEQNYRNIVSNRLTPAGDNALSSTAPLKPYGVPLVAVPLWSQTPQVVEHIVGNTDGTTASDLRYKPISDVVAVQTTIGSETPVDALVEGTDYDVDLVNGTITRLGGAWASGGTVKVTYNAGPQCVLTMVKNLILAIGLNITIEKDRDIFKRTNQYAITIAVDAQAEETDAIVKMKNVKRTLT